MRVSPPFDPISAFDIDLNIKGNEESDVSQHMDIRTASRCVATDLKFEKGPQTCGPQTK